MPDTHQWINHTKLWLLEDKVFRYEVGDDYELFSNYL